MDIGMVSGNVKHGCGSNIGVYTDIEMLEDLPEKKRLPLAYPGSRTDHDTDARKIYQINRTLKCINLV
ncbi:hypothetical protein V6N11_063728 [Hibiscus sabdariffa]|uniref:Uncharacterized protein n=1 Tax=Hibiscus sabdariffa TaxID=183260 RepID=A0ABR2PM90_9ROSI